MPELLLELFSEEIPARMQARAAADLRACWRRRWPHSRRPPCAPSTGRAASRCAATLGAAVPAASVAERGPRSAAPEQALAGFLRKHGAARDAVVQEGDYWVLHKASAGAGRGGAGGGRAARLLRRFPWPKSMRWGGSGSLFTWVRPLRRILCVLDGAVVPFALAEGGDDGHGLRSGDETEGHRFMAPGAFPVRSASEWQAGLLARRVMVDAAQRRQHVADGVAALAAAQGLHRGRRPGAAGRGGRAGGVAGAAAGPHRPGVHGPAGRGDAGQHAGEPALLRAAHRGRRAAPFFAFAANIEAPDGGAAIVAGNERVLRARFSDARHFWDADRKLRLADRVAALDAVTFHAKLGTQGARVHRVMQLAEADRAACRRRPGAGRAGGLAGEGGPDDGHGGRVPGAAGRDGPLLRPARRRGPGGGRRRARPLRAEGPGRRAARRPGHARGGAGRQARPAGQLLRRRREADRLRRPVRAAPGGAGRGPHRARDGCGCTCAR